MNKKAQFFLIAALVLSGIILTLGKAYNISRVENIDTRVYDLSEEIQYETSKVIDNGVFREETSEEMEDNLVELTEYYGSRSPDSDIDIIYGKPEDLKVVKYNGDNGEIKKDTITESATGEDTKIRKEGNKIKIDIVLNEPDQEDNKDKQDGNKKEKKVINAEFDIKEGENLYLVVRKKVNNEEVVIYR